MSYLIVNADDFGYSFNINKGIVEAHIKGIVTSTSLMVDAIAADEAAKLTQYKKLSIGLHFEVKNFDNVEQELKRQVAKFVSIVGKRPDHIDTHKLQTYNPGFSPVLPNYARRYGIPLRQLSGIKSIHSFFGMHADGDVTIARLMSAIDEATDEYNELMCHVGYSDDYLRDKSSYNNKREEELISICSAEIKDYLREKGIELISWNQVPASVRLKPGL